MEEARASWKRTTLRVTNIAARFSGGLAGRTEVG